MDVSRFDAWTRRRFSVSSGGVVAAFLSVAGAHTAVSRKRGKKRKRKKLRCKTELQACNPASAQEPCCPGLNCDITQELAGLRCCRPLRSRCTQDDACCRGLNCSAIGGPQNLRCCATNNDLCADDDDCCPGLGCSSGVCQAIPSDRALKANFATVDPSDMLGRVRDLPIATWNYTADDPAIRHVGPMAQDFAAIFGVGADDRHIHPLDGQGVALAAIQGLVAQIENLRADNARLAARVAALERPAAVGAVPYNESPASSSDGC